MVAPSAGQSTREASSSPPEGVGGVWLRDPACHHLHSTATVFCAGEAEDGLMPVSEDPDDVDTVVLDTEGADGFRSVSR